MPKPKTLLEEIREKGGKEAADYVIKNVKEQKEKERDKKK